MEWLYFVTKPSFMSGMSVWDKIKVWLETNIIVFLAGFSIVALLFLLANAIPSNRVRFIFKWTAGLIPVFFAGITILLLVDNFTYTLFRFGVVNTFGIVRGIFGLGFVLLLIRIQKEFYPTLLENSGKIKRSLRLWVPVFILSLSSFVTFLDFPRKIDTKSIIETENISARPNIILLGSDGISASNLSFIIMSVILHPI
jgi:hypothetical protein